MSVSENKVRLLFTTEKENLDKLVKIQSREEKFNRSKLINEIFLLGLKNYKKVD